LPAVDAAQAVELVEKGIENNPQDYRFYHHLGYIYWRLGEFEKAAQIYSEGSQVPNAPPFLRMMAAKMKSEGGSRETARAIYRQIIVEIENLSKDYEVGFWKKKKVRALDGLNLQVEAGKFSVFSAATARAKRRRSRF
jgi:tetratricopeptide (TPR) repeat protein